MHTRISESGGRRYPQLVEGHRDELGKVRIKVVANLGRLDKLSHGKLDPLINGLNRAVGRLEKYRLRRFLRIFARLRLL